MKTLADPPATERSGSNETRFKKGVSGNPKGRPRRDPPPAASAFDVVLEKNLSVVQNGRSRELTIDEALQQRTYQEAIGGSRAARREVLRMIAKREKALAERRPFRLPVSITQSGPDPENADEAMLILGIIGHDQRWADSDDAGDRYLLEPWAVEAALDRHRGRRLSGRDIDEIRRSTRNAVDLKLPDLTGS